MPFRYNRRRTIRRRRAPRIPYAIPPREVVRKFSVVLKPESLGATGLEWHLNDPTWPYRIATTRGTAGTQPPGLDYWLGTTTTTGPYSTALVTWCKVKHTCFTAQSSPRIWHNYIDTTGVTFTPASPAQLNSRSGTLMHVSNNGDDTEKPFTFKRKINCLKFYDLQDSDAAWVGTDFRFDRANSPVQSVISHVRCSDVANAFIATPASYVITKLTFWVHMRLQNSDHFRDIL